MKKIIITKPDDWHVHFRDGLALHHTVSATAKQFQRALVMPNLVTPLTDINRILTYRDRILQNCVNQNFTPYMTLYLNNQVSEKTLLEASKYPFITGAKLYPQGATTQSNAGVRSIKSLYPLLELMQEKDQVLQIHGEEAKGDIFERELRFIQNVLCELINNFPKLRIVLEHISTESAVSFILQSPPNVVATITPHHLFYNRNNLLSGGIQPHYYCLPILKHEKDQKALQKAAISQNPKFFAGTDSAPHSKETKESACGCAGIFSAPFALALYAHIFDSLDAIDKLDAFMGRFGAEFYQLPINKDEIELIRQAQTIPELVPMGDCSAVPMHAGQSITWSVNVP